MPQLIKLFACAKYSYTMNALCMFNMHVFKSSPKVVVLSEIFKNGSRIVRSSSRALKYLIQFFNLTKSETEARKKKYFVKITKLTSTDRDFSHFQEYTMMHSKNSVVGWTFHMKSSSFKLTYELLKIASLFLLNK